MKLPKLHRTGSATTPAPAAETDGTPAAAPVGGSALGLDDWHGSWPVDDTPAADGPDAEVPMLMNPGSPNIAPS